jgi:hypothetical protein
MTSGIVASTSKNFRIPEGGTSRTRCASRERPVVPAAAPFSLGAAGGRVLACSTVMVAGLLVGQGPSIGGRLSSPDRDREVGYPAAHRRATLRAMADDYLQSLLGTGETIRAEARQHPMALIRFAFQPILVFLAALVCLAIGTWLTPDGQGLFGDIVRWIDTLLGLLTAGLFILAFIWFPVQVLRWTKRRYMVTDRRVLYLDGLLRKNSFDAGLSMITDVGFRQTFLGRRLGYGDLVIATASNRPLHFREIRDALAFKQEIMSAQQGTIEARADEILVSKGLAPTVAAAAVPTPVEPPPAPVPAWDGSDVPQMLEDDTPTLDPMVLGADAGETPPPAAAAEETAGLVAEAAAPVVETASTVEPAEVEPAAEVPAVEVAAAVEAAAEVEPAADVPAVEPAADEPSAADDVVETAEATADDVAAMASDAAEPATTHADALDTVDSSVGGLTEDAKGSGADSVTAALAGLADERDSGAITEEQFETRKRELLDRL